jgi:hypothetical protein
MSHPLRVASVSCGVVTGSFTGESSQVLSDRSVEGYKTRVFDMRKTGVTETDFLVPSKKNFIHDSYEHILSMAI